jgi:hypothetical protein
MIFFGAGVAMGQGGEDFPTNRTLVLWEKSYWLAHVTLPPVNWVQPDFDDGSWWRDPGPVFDGPGAAQGSELALLCLRGKFLVADLSKVKDLRLFMSFRGGAVVYLNGREAGTKRSAGGKSRALDPRERLCGGSA